jgi:hypothetical protein
MQPAMTAAGRSASGVALPVAMAFTPASQVVAVTAGVVVAAKHLCNLAVDRWSNQGKRTSCTISTTSETGNTKRNSITKLKSIIRGRTPQAAAD